jgi:hypothetical protein
MQGGHLTEILLTAALEVLPNQKCYIISEESNTCQIYISHIHLKIIYYHIIVQKKKRQTKHISKSDKYGKHNSK